MASVYGEVKSCMAFIPTVILYKYCMDGAIDFSFGDKGEAIRLTLWPEIMCFEVYRLGKLWNPCHGRIIAWDRGNFTLEYDLCGEDNDFPFLIEALAYAMGYLDVKSFRYEKRYDAPIRDVSEVI